MAQLARRAGLAPLPAAVAGVLPVGAVLLYRYGLHGSIKEELVVALMATAAALAREALDRELSIRLGGADRALRGRAAARVQRGGCRLRAGARACCCSRWRSSRDAGWWPSGASRAAGVAIAVVAVAVNLSDVTSFAEHAGDAFASEGGASTAYLGHLLRASPARSGGGRLVLARLPRAPCRLSTRLENTVVDRRDRSARGRGHRAGAPPEAPRRAVAPDSDGGGGARCSPLSSRPTPAASSSWCCRRPSCSWPRSAASRCWRSASAGCRCWPGSAWRS